MNGKQIGLVVAVVVTGLAAAAVRAQPTPPVINEFVANHTGSDTHEFVEIYGAPSTDYSNWTVLEIEGDSSSNVGTIDGVWNVGATNAGGYWSTGFLSNQIENGTLSLLLVETFSGNAGDDLDTNDDGTLDSTPWVSLRDFVAVGDGDAGDQTYCSVVLLPNFDGDPYTVGGASRIPNGLDTDAVGDWVRNDYDGAGLPGFIGTPEAGEALNTHMAVNQLVPEPATLGLLSVGLAALIRRRRRR